MCRETMTNQDRCALFFRILCVLTVATGAGAKASPPQPSHPKTVVDYFLLVPAKYFPYDLSFRQELLRGQYRGGVVDIRNGYISWDASDAPDSFEFVVFRKSNGTSIVAYNDTGDDFDREPDDAGLKLLSYEGGRWHDVTMALLPAAVNKKLSYKLPRNGRSIEVTDDQGRNIYTLEWANDRFQLKRAAGR
jgi:hypothetical protein